MLGATDGGDRTRLMGAILAGHDTFLSTLEPFLGPMPDESLMITNSLGGALRLIDASHSSSRLVSYDGDGNSSAFRIISFIAQLDKRFPVLSQLNSSAQANILIFEALTFELAIDDSYVPRSPGFMKEIGNSEQTALEDVLWFHKSTMIPWILEDSVERKSLVEEVLSRLLARCSSPDSASYYHARAYVSLANAFDDVHGTRHRSPLVNIKAPKTSTDALVAAAILATTPESDNSRKLCNELLSDLTAGKASNEDGK